MDPKTIFIIVLLLFGWYWYNNPLDGKDKIDAGIDQVQSLFDKAKTIGECPSNYDPVCAAGTEFDNSCLAQKAGHTNTTAGVCSG